MTRVASLAMSGDWSAVPSHAISADGTEIGYWSRGSGLPLVLVHGTASLHRTWDRLAPHLEGRFSMHAVDRRGRGASGDSPAYHIDREFEDVAAVVDAIATAGGERVSLLGHSFGGVCALGAAGLTANLRRLVLYEGWPANVPGQSDSLPLAGSLDRLLESEDLDGLLHLFLTEVAKISEEDLEMLRGIPGWWESRVAVAHTISREYAHEARLGADRDVHVKVPTLLLIGGESPTELTAGSDELLRALPEARLEVLEGQQHLAHVEVPELFAARVTQFLAS